ncbi:DUF6603 domain-containing protein [uncultured Gimesia sp.]|uniref:DUF6603 domain-containing protein n=1 Tax=uncultured Gimesia sp. TaxID=1678688 RepID=UPI0030D8AD05
MSAGPVSSIQFPMKGLRVNLLDALQYDAGAKTITVENAQLGTLGGSLSKSTGSKGLTFSGVQAPPAKSSGMISFQASSLVMGGEKIRILFPAEKTTVVRCDIHNADSQPVLIISVTLAVDWKLTDSISWLSATYWQNVGFKSGNAPNLEATLFISTGTFEDSDRGISLTEGVSLFGILDESQGPIKSAAWITGDDPKAFGLIQLEESGPPQISIGLEVANATDGLAAIFQKLKVPIDARLLFSPQSIEVVSGLYLSATINWANKPVKLETTIPGTGGGVLDLAVIGPLPLPTPDDLTQYLGGTSLTTFLPKQFTDALDSIHVGKLRLGIGLGTKTLEYVGVTLTALETANLVIVKKWVEIGNIRFDVNVFHPLSGKPSPSYRLSGTLEIGGVDLLVSASLVPTPRKPDLTVVVQLDELSVIDLTMIVEKFGLPAGAPKILVDEFQMSGSTSGSYFIRAALSEHPVGPEQAPFIMNALVFELHYPGENGPEVTLEGAMTIAGVDAELLLSNQGGWEIHGQAGEQQPIEMGQLIEDLGSKFGITVPSPVANLELKNLKFKYAPATGSFSFTCEGDFKVHDTPVSLVVTIDVTRSLTGDESKPQTVKGKKGYSATFGGQLTLSGLEFNLIFNTQSLGTDVFIASYSHTGEQKGISIHDLIAGISSDLASIVPASLAIGLKDAKFVFYKDQSGKKFALGLDLSAGINLSDLPLIGAELPQDATISISDLQIVYASVAFEKQDVGVVNPLLPKTVMPLPVSGAVAGLSAGAGMQFGSTPPQRLSLPISGSSPPAKPTGSLPKPAGTAGVAATASASTTSKVKWFDLQKSFGPVAFQRIGVSYEQQALWFLLDGSLTIGGLKISVIGMGIGSPLDQFDPEFQLRGLGLEYESGPLTIGGSFMEVDPPPKGTKFEYTGDAVIQAEKFSLAAIGSYAVLENGQASLFVFASIEAAFGGPPSVFVTGLAAGFGYNRTVAIPAPDEVAHFPLLALTADSGPQTPTPADVLAILEGQAEYAPGKKKAWISPYAGEYWLALGVEFTSYELMHSRVVLIAKFGKELEIALLGLSSIRLPQSGDVEYAFAELQIEADWKPAEGFFGLTAILTSNSFVITPDCHLTGGFAFYLWYSGDREGQFVVTLGGYHPLFRVPDFYPKVPRLGFNWAVSDKVTIKGGAYFALTPAAVMAGGGLEVLFHDGNLKAWFIAHADMLITFKPFHYLIDIGISIGASYRLHLLFITKTVTIELGASLELWGPPSGGKAHISWFIISFTVSFGADQGAGSDTPIEWSTFKSLLPALDNVCKIQANDGLSKSIPSKLDAKKKIWLVRCDLFEFSTASAIPSSKFSHGQGTSLTAEEPYNVQVRPMNKTNVNSTHHLTVTRDGAPHDVSSWSIQPAFRNMPTTLWGDPLKDGLQRFKLNPSVPSNDTVPQVPVGLNIKPPRPNLGSSAGEMPFQLLKYDDLRIPGEMPISNQVTATMTYRPQFNDTSIKEIEGISGEVKTSRDDLYTVLSSSGIYSGSNAAMENMANQAGHLYAAAPLEV